MKRNCFNYCKFCKCDFIGTYYEHAVDSAHKEFLIKNYDEVIKHRYSNR